MLNSTRVILGLLALTLIAGANGQPLTWYVQGVTFDDGGTASGSFVFDAGSNTFSFVNVTTTNGTTRNGANYTRPNPVAGSTFVVLLTSATGNLTGTPVFAAEFPSAMTDFGGAVDFSTSALSFHQEQSCASSDCSTVTVPTRFITAGTIQSSETLFDYMFFGG